MTLSGEEVIAKIESLTYDCTDSLNGMKHCSNLEEMVGAAEQLNKDLAAIKWFVFMQGQSGADAVERVLGKIQKKIKRDKYK